MKSGGGLFITCFYLKTWSYVYRFKNWVGICAMFSLKFKSTQFLNQNFIFIRIFMIKTKDIRTLNRSSSLSLRWDEDT